MTAGVTRRGLLLTLGVAACDGATARARSTPPQVRASASSAPTASEASPAHEGLSLALGERGLELELVTGSAAAETLGADPAQAILVVTIGASASTRPLSLLGPAVLGRARGAGGGVTYRAAVDPAPLLASAPRQTLFVHACCRQWISGVIAVPPVT